MVARMENDVDFEMLRLCLTCNIHLIPGQAECYCQLVRNYLLLFLLSGDIVCREGDRGASNYNSTADLAESFEEYLFIWGLCHAP